MCVWWSCLLSEAASLVTVYCLMLVTAMDAQSCDVCSQNKLRRQFSTLQTTKLLSVILARDKIGSYAENCGSTLWRNNFSLDSVASKQKLKSICINFVVLKDIQNLNIAENQPYVMDGDKVSAQPRPDKLVPLTVITFSVFRSTINVCKLWQVVAHLWLTYLYLFRREIDCVINAIRSWI